MKKILAILLALIIVFTFTACGSKENTSSDISGNTSDNQTINSAQNDNETTSNDALGDGDVSSETDSSDSGDNSAATPIPSGAKNPENAVNQANTDNPSGTGNQANTNKPSGTSNQTNTNKPSNNTTAAHTHSFSAATCTEAKKCSCGEAEGKPLGHKWEEATCKAPKTCSVCKKTEGNKVNHVVSGTTCKWCKEVVPVSPTLLKNREYDLYKLTTMPEGVYPFEGAPCLYNIYISFGQNEMGSEGHGVEGDWLRNNGYNDECDEPVYYNGKDYYLKAGGRGGSFEKSISNNHIVVNMYGEKIEFELLSNDTLKVISVSDHFYEDEISIGDILV